jgi:hypothetical protein
LAEATRTVGFPVVLKADAEGALHKSDAGAIALDVTSVAAAEQAFDRFVETFGANLRGVLVQRQLPQRLLLRGVEMLVGLSRSERFGPLLVVGSGGTTTELIADREVIVAPATRTEIREALGRLRLAPLLRGDDRHPGLDVDALIDIVHRIGMLAEDCAELVEVDLNPVVLSVGGAVCLDVRMRRGATDEPLNPLRGLRPAFVL